MVWITPVSYTHLDVYKRQQYQEIELFDKLGLFSNGRIARDNLPEGVYCYDPVSYTHLDVYKRQLQRKTRNCQLLFAYQ